MQLLNVNDLAIRLAKANGSLAVTKERNARLGVDYWAISDADSIIEVCNTEEEARARVSEGFEGACEATIKAIESMMPVNREIFLEMERNGEFYPHEFFTSHVHAVCTDCGARVMFGGSK